MERTVSTHEYPANNAHAHKFTTQYGMVTSKTVQFHYDEKNMKSLQFYARSNLWLLGCNVLDQDSEPLKCHRLFLMLDHTHCHLPTWV